MVYQPRGKHLGTCFVQREIPPEQLNKLGWGVSQWVVEHVDARPHALIPTPAFFLNPDPRSGSSEPKGTDVHRSSPATWHILLDS